MYRAAVIALALGVANAVPVEWKGVFFTPEATYTWLAQKTLGKANAWRYVDATMKIAAIPVSMATAQTLANSDSAGTTALALACEELRNGGTIIPAQDKCYTLIFNELTEETTWTVDTTNTDGVAFFAQHLPWEFETTKHYFKDSTTADIEPVVQDPCPGGPCDQAGEASGDGHDGHDHGGGASAGWNDEYSGYCVCQAKANNWVLDCGNKAKVQEAVDALDANPACAGISPPQSCIDHFYVLESHHDHCLHDEIPTGAELKLHYYEQFYTACLVKRRYNTNIGDCATVSCSDSTTLTNAVQTLLLGNCNSTTKCASDSCAGAIKTVLMAHDTCAESSLMNSLETTLHKFEDHCAAQLCNSGPSIDPYSQACEASVSSGGFGLQDYSFLMAWAFPMFMLTQ